MQLMKNRFLHVGIYLFIIFYHKVFGLITINKIITRPPKEKDIGLIFDVSVINTDTDKKEMLEYSIRSDGTCTVNVSSNQVADNMGRVVGGEFGFIEAGAKDIVSLIWPTVSLYNRVGFCPIVIISTNAKNDEFHLKQLIGFDTRFDSLDPDGHIYKAHKDFKDCRNWDLDYFKNCTPVNCEERYFGLRSYYNETAEACEEVPKCSNPSTFYDQFANECVDTTHFFTEQELSDIKLGKFDQNVLELKPETRGNKNFPDIILNEPLDPKNTFSNFFGHDFYKRAAIRPHKPPDDENDMWMYPVQEPDDNFGPLWIKGLEDGLLIVFATITIYVLICFAIFLVVTWLSRRPCRESDGTTRPVLPSPVSSDTNVYAPSSVISQR